MNDFLKPLIGLSVALVVGYGVGRYLQPAEIRVKKEQVIKEVEVVRKDIVIVEHEVKRPDGTTTIERRTEDRSVERTDTNTQNKEETRIVNTKPQWKIQGGIGMNYSSAQLDSLKPIYSVGVERRILGPIFVGIQANTDKYIGFTASWEL